MYRVSKVFVLFLSLFVLWGCSDDDDKNNPVIPGEGAEITLIVGLEEGETIDLSDYPQITYEGAASVELSELFDAETVLPLFDGLSGDLRDNCVFRFHATDGFTPIERGRPDLTWDIFQQGVIVESSLNTYFPVELELPGAYNVNELESIEVLPKVSISLSDTTFWYDLADFSYETIEETDIISLDQLVPDSLISLSFPNWPAENLQDLFSYRFHALDGFSPFNVGREDLTWVVLQQGHMEVITRNTSFPGELGLPGAYNTGNLASISLHRIINLDTPGDDAFFRIEELETETISTNDGEKTAISLANLVPSDYQDGSYTFSCYGKSTDIANTPEMSWQDFQNGYYLIESDKTWFGGGAFANNDYRIRFVEGIRITQQ